MGRPFTFAGLALDVRPNVYLVNTFIMPRYSLHRPYNSPVVDPRRPGQARERQRKAPLAGGDDLEHATNSSLDSAIAMGGPSPEAVCPLTHMGGNHEFYALLVNCGSGRVRVASRIRHRQHKLSVSITRREVGDIPGERREC